ncbi:TlpA family protein disulfide reductase [Candidatus Sumerlaeota bacterium]|nr:TlpA family protein disulfide reductase [Candidatus Sumerlaeota bacterium]
MIGYFEEFRDSAQGAPFKFEANQEIIAIAIELLNDTKKVDAAIASEKDTERVLRLKLHAASLYGEIGVPDEAGKLIEQVLAATKQEYPQLRKQAESLRVTIAPTGLQFPEFPEGTKDLDGKEIKLSDYKGKVVMVDFWASWCGPCISEMPNVVSAYKKYHSKGFEIIGVSADKSKDDMLAAMKKFGMTWRQYFDGLGWENKAFRRYGITSIPSMHLIGPDGKIVASRLRGNRLGQQLEKLLGGKKEDTSKESRKAGKKQ